MSPSRTTKSRKNVSFNSCVTVKECLHKNNYTLQEKSAAFFNRKEMMATRLACKRTLKMMKQGTIDMGQDDYCTRGLETRLQKTPERVYSMIAVLREQQFQFCNGVRDEERIAQFYQHFTFKSQCTAYATAIQDREAIAPQQYSAPVFKQQQRIVRTMPSLRITQTTVLPRTA